MAAGVMAASRPFPPAVSRPHTSSRTARRIRPPRTSISNASAPGARSMSAASAPSPTCTEPMLRIPCPWCGVRDESEFRYRGDATRSRPAADAGLDAFSAYVYERVNPRDWHIGGGLHVAGCRRLLKVGRHTLPHEIHSVEAAA